VIIALTEKGKKMSTTEFTTFLDNNSTHGEEIVMIIGGPYGLHESILNLANFQLSLSALTFTHEMARLILLEQIYRATTILTGKQYHY